MLHFLIFDYNILCLLSFAGQRIGNKPAMRHISDSIRRRTKSDIFLLTAGLFLRQASVFLQLFRLFWPPHRPFAFFVGLSARFLDFLALFLNLFALLLYADMLHIFK